MLCDHSWPADLSDADACCTACGLNYRHWSTDGDPVQD